MDVVLIILNRLENDPNVAGQLGDGFFPEYDPARKHNYPIAVYHETAITDLTVSSGPTGFKSSVLKIEVIDPDYGKTRAVGNAIEKSINGYASDNLQGCFLASDGVEENVIDDPDTEAILYYCRTYSFDLRYTI